MKIIFLIISILGLVSCQKETFKVEGRYFPNEYREEYNLSANSILTVSSQTIKSGETISVNLQALDLNNNLITVEGLVSFVSEGTANGSFSKVIFDGAGNYSSTFTAQKTGTFILKAKLNPYKKMVTVGSIPMTVTIGDISLTQSTITLSASMITVGDFLTYTLTIRDINGNLVDDSTLQINPTVLDGTSEGSFSDFNYIGNGKYQGKLTGTVVGSPTHINLSIRRQGSVYSNQTFMVY